MKQFIFVGFYALLLAGSAAAQPFLGQPKFRCNQVNLARLEDYQSVTGFFDALGVPTQVRVFSTYVPNQVLSYRERATVAAGGTTDYVTWDITGRQTGTAVNYYFLLLPKAVPSTGTFEGELNTYFDRGQAGFSQNTMRCEIQARGGV
ncbi:hypothetical protein [Anthocerotibacter panamensis]|uniref:hypothetical protein n=1 Tax=Anthocerotibacter panamensis TaxID=2857077 RepID=UPI001C40567B|nr:hypothetical protein [Anthocerotibacter panamensis]